MCLMMAVENQKYKELCYSYKDRCRYVTVYYSLPWASLVGAWLSGWQVGLTPALCLIYG